MQRGRSNKFPTKAILRVLQGYFRLTSSSLQQEIEPEEWGRRGGEDSGCSVLGACEAGELTAPREFCAGMGREKVG
jgi:hypothetical protein